MALAACLAACASERPDFSRVQNENVADAAGVNEDDASVSTATAAPTGSSTGGGEDAATEDESDGDETSGEQPDTNLDNGESTGAGNNGTTSDEAGANGDDTDAALGDGTSGGSNEGAEDGGGTSRSSNGTTCRGASDCESGFCVDGVCCDTSCQGVCATCDQAGSEGTCTAPASDDACGTLVCPGDTECRKYEGVELDANCAALNSCVAEAECTATPVAADTPCQEGAGTCDGNGECVVPDKLSLGETCAAADECGSGHCVESVDGERVCCDAACDGLCEGCGSDGRCDATPDDDAACEAITCDSDTACTSYPEPLEDNRCASFGQCVTSAAYCRADHAEDGASCGDNRACDGAGECELSCPTQRGAERTCTVECPCDAGAGVCSSNAQCDAGLVCVTGGGIKYGLTGNTCLPAHCDNDVQDASESSIDCGGQCGCTATLEILAEYASPTGISDDGNKVVGYSSNSSGRWAYLWDETGTRAELSDDHTAQGISGDGRVIIGAGDVGPVRWVNGGQPERILPERFTGGVPYDVSRTGATIVGRGYTADGTWEVFRWTNGATTSITGLYDFVALSADGALALGHEPGESGARGAPAFWSTGSGTTPFTVPGNWDVTSAWVMSRNGQHVVGEAIGQSPALFVWSQGGAVAQLASTAAANAYGNDVSNDGVVVGQSCRGGCPALYWTAESEYEPRLIEDLMRERGLELGEITIWNARLITPDGKTIVGESMGGLWRLRLH